MSFLWFLSKYTILLGGVLWLILPFDDNRFDFLLLLFSTMSYGPILVSYLEYEDWLKISVKFGK